jgi:hypothetical protein
MEAKMRVLISVVADAVDAADARQMRGKIWACGSGMWH